MVFISLIKNPSISSSKLSSILMTMRFVFFFFFFFILLPHISSTTACENSYCRRKMAPPIRFPFRLKNDTQNSTTRCSYNPDFDLSCNDIRQTIITLPFSGNFSVTNIDYESQKLWINDPNQCLPRRYLQKTITPLGTPFRVNRVENFTFLNCSNGDGMSGGYMLEPISCLSNENYSVMWWPTKEYEVGFYPEAFRYCLVMSTVMVPMMWAEDWRDVNGDIELSWSNPDCAGCEKRGGHCGFKSELSLDVGCFNVPKNGLPRSVKYGIIIGIGIPGLLSIIGLGCYFCGRVRAYTHRNRPNTNFSATISLQPNILVMGLDEPTIKSYPKTLLGESKRLPKPTDNTCPICLSEYQPKETLRTIPECNHFFHVNCIDPWLKQNGTCPLCRNSPVGSSSSTTPSSSMSSFTSLSLSLSSRQNVN